MQPNKYTSPETKKRRKQNTKQLAAKIETNNWPKLHKNLDLYRNLLLKTTMRQKLTSTSFKVT